MTTTKKYFLRPPGSVFRSTTFIIIRRVVAWIGAFAQYPGDSRSFLTYGSRNMYKRFGPGGYMLILIAYVRFQQIGGITEGGVDHSTVHTTILTEYWSAGPHLIRWSKAKSWGCGGRSTMAEVVAEHWSCGHGDGANRVCGRVDASRCIVVRLMAEKALVP